MVEVQPLPELADDELQELTKVAGVLTVLQVIEVKLLPELADCGEQV